MRPVILYRAFDIEPLELEVARRYFFTTDSRMDVQRGDLVIGRYSMLPFYTEQERDIKRVGATLVNTFDQHDYIADMRRWYADLREPTSAGARLTPRTWFGSEELYYSDYDGPLVVKGITNSKKQQWKTHMFAKNKSEAVDVMIRLQEDTLIGQQAIAFREYIPLKKMCDGINGMPIGKEFRLFFLGGELLSGAFYWASYAEDMKQIPDIAEVPLAFIGEVNARIRGKTNFVVVDVAQTADGEWLVIELNDAQQSGLSLNDPVTLYRRLQEVLLGD